MPVTAQVTPAAGTAGPAAGNGHFFLTALRKSLRSNKVAQVAMVILFVVVLVGIFGPLIAPHDPAVQDLTERLRPPIWMAGHAPSHLLGTDRLGRDLLSRIIYGARISLLVGVAATLMSGLIGAVLGVLCGYYRGWIDMVFMRLADVQLSFPTILLALVIVAVLGPSL